MEKATRKRIFRKGSFQFLNSQNTKWPNIPLDPSRNDLKWPHKAQQGKLTGEKKATVRLSYEKKFENFKSYVESLPQEISNRELADACGLNLKTVYAYQRRLKDPTLDGLSAYKALPKDSSTNLPIDIQSNET